MYRVRGRKGLASLTLYTATMPGSTRIIPLGGLGEVGKNMTVIEADGEAVVIDAGLAFPRDEHLGVDLILPDFSYLLDRDTKPHSILPGAVTGHRGRKQALLTPQGPRASANVKGSRGKLMWERGVTAVYPKIAGVVSNSVAAAALRAFGL